VTRLVVPRATCLCSQWPPQVFFFSTGAFSTFFFSPMVFFFLRRPSSTLCPVDQTPVRPGLYSPFSSRESLEVVSSGKDRTDFHVQPLFSLPATIFFFPFPSPSYGHPLHEISFKELIFSLLLPIRHPFFDGTPTRSFFPIHVSLSPFWLFRSISPLRSMILSFSDADFSFHIPQDNSFPPS